MKKLILIPLIVLITVVSILIPVANTSKGKLYRLNREVEKLLTKLKKDDH